MNLSLWIADTLSTVGSRGGGVNDIMQNHQLFCIILHCNLPSSHSKLLVQHIRVAVVGVGISGGACKLCPTMCPPLKKCWH